MTDLDYDTLLAFASGVAKDTGVIMRRYFHDADQHVTRKKDKTVVTVADTAVNQLVIQRVAETYPTHGVLGEEASDHNGRRELWVCDPIDGTNGFTIGEPTAAFSLAFVVDGVPMLAIAYDPFQDRLYSAIKGRGSYCNGVALQVSDCGLDEAVMAMSGSFDETMKHLGLCQQLTAAGATLRMFGGIVFKGCLVAEGKIDAVVFRYRGAHDIAAVKLLVEEAGGKVTDLYGNEQRYDQPLRGAIISNGVAHQQLLEIMSAYGTEQYLSH